MTPRAFLDHNPVDAIGSPRANLQFFLLLGGQMRRPAISTQSGEPGPGIPYWPGNADPIMGVGFTTSLTDVARMLGERGMYWTIVATPPMFKAFVGPNVGKGEVYTCADGATAPMALCRAWAMHMIFTIKESVDE